MNQILRAFIKQEPFGILKMIILPMCNEFFLAGIIFLYSFMVDGVVKGNWQLWGILSLVYLLLFMLTFYFTTVYGIRCKTDFEIDLKQRVLASNIAQPEEKFETISSGEKLEAFQSTASLSQYLGILPSVYFKMMKICLLLSGIGFFLGWQVLIINIVLMGMTLWVRKLSNKIAPYNHAFLKTEEQLSNQFLESVEGRAVIKGYFVEQKLATKFAQALDNNLVKILKKRMADDSLRTFFRFFNVFVGSISLLAVIVFSSERQLGFLISSTMFSAYLAQAVGELMQVNQDRSNTLSVFEKYHEYYLPVQENLKEEEIKSFEVKKMNYNRENQEIIHEFTQNFSDKGLYLIKGESGIGKSTILKLLAGLYTASCGKILINGKECSEEQLRNQVVYMPQQSKLLLGSISENIFFGEVDDTFAKEIQDVFPDLTKKTGMSGGQRQQVNLLRALLSKRQIVLLDEPMSALDTKNVSRFKELIANITKDKIIIVVAHDSKLDTLAKEIIYLRRNESEKASIFNKKIR